MPRRSARPSGRSLRSSSRCHLTRLRPARTPDWKVATTPGKEPFAPGGCGGWRRSPPWRPPAWDSLRRGGSAGAAETPPAEGDEGSTRRGAAPPGRASGCGARRARPGVRSCGAGLGAHLPGAGPGRGLGGPGPRPSPCPRPTPPPPGPGLATWEPASRGLAATLSRERRPRRHHEEVVLRWAPRPERGGDGVAGRALLARAEAVAGGRAGPRGGDPAGRRAPRAGFDVWRVRADQLTQLHPRSGSQGPEALRPSGKLGFFFCSKSPLQVFGPARRSETTGAGGSLGARTL